MTHHGGFARPGRRGNNDDFSSFTRHIKAAKVKINRGKISG
jgi:hypothetical protein